MFGMRLKLSVGVSVAVAVLLSLAVIGSGATLLYAWQTRKEMARLVMGEESGASSALELDLSLLRQRGYAALYMLDQGSRRWIDELRRRQTAFSGWLQQADNAADTAQEHQIVAQIRQAYQQYDDKRSQVVSLFDQGNAEQARKLFLGDQSTFSERVADLCAALLAADRAHARQALAEDRSELDRLSYFVVGDVALTAALGCGLVWFLVAGVFRPLHQMALRARSASPAADGLRLADDLSALGSYLQSLLAEFTRAQSELARSRDQAESNDRLAALGRAIASVAHEIRNPLTTIGGFANAIRKRPDDPHRVIEHAGIIHEESCRLERLLTDITTLARTPDLTPRVQPLGEVVVRAGRLLRAQAPQGVAVEVDCAGEVPSVPIDADRIEQVLLNLVRNAMEAMGAGGTVRLMVGAVDGGARLVVSDDGPGMAPEVRAHAFDAFYTTKNKGTGLGLLISRQIILAHGGTMGLDSAPGQGTTCTIFLPGLKAISGG